MSNIIEIPKANANYDNYPCWVDTFNTEGVRIRPHIICNCGEVTNISNHHIHSDGRITESYYHYRENRPDHPGCGWHVFLKMKDWSGEEFLPRSNYQNKLTQP